MSQIESATGGTKTATREDLRALVARALPRLWRYLKTWQVADGRFAGMIATWWSSSVETAVPHPMNQFPMILGALCLHRAGARGGDWLSEASRVGDGMAGSVTPEGRMENDWGDIPGKTTGPIFFTNVIRGLCTLYEHNAQGRYLDAARRLDGYNNRWVSGDKLVGCLVTNQVLSWAWSRLCLARVLDDRSLVEQARRIATHELEHQIRGGAFDGAYYQGRFDDKLISIYVGKCIQPMVEVHRAVGGDERLLQSAARAAKYLLTQETEHGIWTNVQLPVSPWQTITRPFATLDRRVFGHRLPLYRVRRMVERWKRVEYPSWWARSADPIRALWELSNEGAFDRADAERYTRRLLATQLPHGGFPNTAGFFGDATRQTWQDRMPSTRWNAYVFFLLARLAEMLGVTELEPCDDMPSEWSEQLADDCVLLETATHVEQRQRGELCWRLQKSTGKAEFVAPAWRGDLSGHRGLPETRNA